MLSQQLVAAEEDAAVAAEEEVAVQAISALLPQLTKVSGKHGASLRVTAN